MEYLDPCKKCKRPKDRRNLCQGTPPFGGKSAQRGICHLAKLHWEYVEAVQCRGYHREQSLKIYHTKVRGHLCERRA